MSQLAIRFILFQRNVVTNFVYGLFICLPFRNGIIYRIGWSYPISSEFVGFLYCIQRIYFISPRSKVLARGPLGSTVDTLRIKVKESIQYEKLPHVIFYHVLSTVASSEITRNLVDKQK